MNSHLMRARFLWRPQLPTRVYPPFRLEGHLPALLGFLTPSTQVMSRS
jgi:hypothetical protein